PRTPRGKARSSRNALKHGLLAKDVVLHGPDATEHQADFDALLADLIRELKPRGLIEETLVERIATCYWRLRRAQRFETGAIRETLDAPDPDADAVEDRRIKLERTERELADARRFVELLKKPADHHSEEQRQEIERCIDTLAHRHRFRLLHLPEDVARAKIRETHLVLLEELKGQAGIDRCELGEAENNQRKRLARRPLLASLPAKDDVVRIARYENMLDRQLHRALEALQRLRRRPRRKVPAHGTSPKRRPGVLAGSGFLPAFLVLFRCGSCWFGRFDFWTFRRFLRVPNRGTRRSRTVTTNPFDAHD
ncbi:MAG: hypothetical protein HW404_1426, partial [Anaerolineales bacterium]|nr:hypothetical protein [Anaerolineales bacterium]